MSENEIQETAVSSGASQALVAARERLGLSQKEVADRLYLTTTFIRYIDAGDFGKIPKQAFVKGYLRSYAREVKLSGDEVVSLYEAELKSREPEPEIKGVTEEDVSTSAITGPVLQTGMVGLGALLLIVALVWWLVSEPESQTPRVTQPDVQLQELPEPQLPTQQLQEQELPEQGLPEQEPPGHDAPPETVETADAPPNGLEDTQPDLPEPAAGTASTAAEDEPVDEIAATLDETPGNETADNEAADDEPADDRRPEPEDILIEWTSDDERRYITADAGGFDELEVSFTAECWIEVEDSEHGLIYHDLHRPGDLLTIYGTGPFEILLGRASGVEMIYNGQLFEVGPYINEDETAKIIISD